MKNSMKVLIVAGALLALTGCGSPARVVTQIPAPPAAAPATFNPPIDVATALFRTAARNIGPAYIYDQIDANEIVRVAYAPNGLTETHSVLGIDRGRNCIFQNREESWNRDPSTSKPTWMYAVQVYPTKPCWAPLLIAPGASVTTTIKDAPWTWSHFDATGAQIGDSAKGLWSDATVLTSILNPLPVTYSLLEYYVDATDPGLDPVPYCVLGSYDLLGLASLTPGNCAAIVP